MSAPKNHKPYNTKGEGGAPKEHTDAFIEKEAAALLAWVKVPSNFYFKNFALERGYHPQRLSEFAKKNHRFSEALEIAQATQECRLVGGGLMSEFNSSITKFVLSNCHGWAEKQQVAGDAVNPLGFILQSVDGKSKDLTAHE